LAEREAEITSAGRISRRWSSLIGLGVILGSEYVVRDAFISEGAGALQIGVALGIEWIVALFLLLYWIPKVEHRKLGSIGFRKFRIRYVWIAVAAYIVYALISTGLESALKSTGQQTLRDLSPGLRHYGFPLLFCLFLTGTFVEEIFYRGYVIERLSELTGRKWVAGIVSWGSFTLVHLRFFGVGPTMEVAVIGAVFVLLYVMAKSIWPSIIVHGINDTFGFLIGPFIR
jgi:membrane protease YdiL (CAAX protease family)